jgi:catechol 2,3-dioxygenase-like lactoylglutathione lyase family enzyme
MIIGLHTLIYSKDAEKDRAFFKDVLGFNAVDSGGGWLIFAAPPTELGVHPTDEGGEEMHELYLMCDDIKKTTADLKAKGIKCSEVNDAGWGLLTMITLPGGSELGLYEPRHPMAIKP